MTPHRGTPSGQTSPQAETPLVAVVGPTASGKSALAVEVALRLGGEIVNADAFQLYRGMDVGTATPTEAERRGVPHHLLDVLDIDQEATVAVYQRLADAGAAIMSAIPPRTATRRCWISAPTPKRRRSNCGSSRRWAQSSPATSTSEMPRVGLLNIGEEDMKGHEVVQAAHALLAASGLNYIGFVEGDDIFSGDVDVVVTDGFTGNVALKTMEGRRGLIAERCARNSRLPGCDKLAGLIARPVLRRVAASLDPRRYNGACMVGIDGIVVKSHGGAEGSPSRERLPWRPSLRAAA